MTEDSNRRIVLASRPVSLPALDNFRIERTAIPSLEEGQVLLKIRYLSLDPYMRGRMSAAKSYATPVEIGGVMEGGTVAEVVATKNPDYRIGEIVLSHSGWQTYAAEHGAGLRKLDPDLVPVTTALGVFGMPGFAAYSGLLNIGQPATGETVVVAAASGPVGSVVGQIARIKGARAVGIAGGQRKCEFAKNTFGFDSVIDHTSPDFDARLREACPNGVDVYFENVGGKVWDGVFPLLNKFARIPVCGLISQYNDSGPFDGPDRLPLVMASVLSKSLTVRGFIQRDFADQRPVFYNEMADWLTQGVIKYKEDIVDGLEQAPEAFIGMLQGKNFGKLLVRL
ncbi:NADP-dependent oxidoreductase [Phyllobacterium sophorae]|uniref:NADP-dependent oxidoreductase n=1 Tax=Phyllobacterium sophorae TaxID=1520277 RepID=A0A2P7BFC8_9HYPH|nr:NADP-dependent oxidoreductase [Phyllobacterium sophorae]PSH65170.1 NADP-dependent oxidoreductase [Phyllobacterium sophorae]